MEILISKGNLIHNLEEFKKISPKDGVAPVLKSNAYGHGLIQVARILDNEQTPFLVVDSYFEALTLRTEKIKSPILIIGYTLSENIHNNNLKNVAFTITSPDQLRELSANLKKTGVFHLKIDTGMNRQGVRIEDTDESVRLIKSNKNIILEGICSHFADASNLDTTFTKKQIGGWNLTVKKFCAEFPNLKYKHLSATGGHPFSQEIDANVSRLGLGLYGIAPGPRLAGLLDLKPVLAMKSLVSGIKEVKAGESVGYDLLYKAEKNIKVATIPAGYYENVDKRLTNKGILKIKGIDCPIVGRVSMNITTVDVGAVPDLKLNDEVLIVSNKSEDKNSVENIAKICGTSTYEILIHFPRQIRRTVID